VLQSGSDVLRDIAGGIDNKAADGDEGEVKGYVDLQIFRQASRDGGESGEG
jgi:hypothetical protein